MEGQRENSIVKIAMKYGVIQGVLAFVVFLVRIWAGIKQNSFASVVDTVLLIVLMVLAQREFKRAHAGKMTYPQGLGSGTLLSSAGALVTCVLVYVYVKYVSAGYLAAALQAQRTALAQRGITGAQAQLAMGITSAIMTPVGIAVTSLITGVVAGFIVALIVSIFTQKDPMAV